MWVLDAPVAPDNAPQRPVSYMNEVTGMKYSYQHDQCTCVYTGFLIQIKDICCFILLAQNIYIHSTVHIQITAQSAIQIKKGKTSIYHLWISTEQLYILRNTLLCFIAKRSVISYVCMLNMQRKQNPPTGTSKALNMLYLVCLLCTKLKCNVKLFLYNQNPVAVLLT